MTATEQALWTGPTILVFWGLPAAAIWLQRRRMLPATFEFFATIEGAIAGYMAFEAWRQQKWVPCAIQAVAAGLWIYLWWVSGGNNRWRKLKRRIAERVAVTGSRLAVVAT